MEEVQPRSGEGVQKDRKLLTNRKISGKSRKSFIKTFDWLRELDIKTGWSAQTGGDGDVAQMRFWWRLNTQ